MSSRASTDARIGSAIVITIALATFANSLFNGFALDDNFIVAGNPRVHQLGSLRAIWLTPYWPSHGELLGLYRPLAIFGYAVQWAVGGGAPWVFHTVNVLLHALVSLLVFLLLRRLASPPAALIGGILFAVHPLHTEVVANVVGQAEMIAAAGVLAACLIHAGRPADAIAPGGPRLVAIAVIFFVSLLAKEGSVVLPGLLVAIDAAQRRIRIDRNGLARYAAGMAFTLILLVALLGAYLTLRVHVLGSIGGIDAAPSLPFLRQEGRIFSALRAWPEYVRLLVWPFDLSADYSPGVILPATGFTPMVVLGTLLLVATAALALATFTRPRAGLPAAWFLIAVFPVSNLALPIGVLLAERVLYLPSVAICVAAAFLADRLRADARPRTLRFATVGAVALIAAFAVRSVMRNPDWDSTEAVWDALVRDHPEDYRSQWVNGFRARQKGNLEIARQYFEIAHRIWPQDAEMLNALAGVHIEQGDYAPAIPMLERSRELSDVLEQTEILLAFAYLTQDRFEDAMIATDRAQRLGSDPATVLALRAQALEGLGRIDGATGAWRVAVRYPKGRTWTFWSMLARDLARLELDEEARAAADSAAATTSEQGVLAGIDRLREAIDRHCYRPGAAPDGCVDPLADWAIVLPPAAQEIASNLQNARD